MTSWTAADKNLFIAFACPFVRRRRRRYFNTFGNKKMMRPWNNVAKPRICTHIWQHIFYWANPGIVLFIFVLFTLQFKYKLIKTLAYVVLGILMWGRMMVGTDGSTELWIQWADSRFWYFSIYDVVYFLAFILENFVDLNESRLVSVASLSVTRFRETSQEMQWNPSLET